MRAAEKVLDGPIDKAGGAKDKRGKKRGPYGVGGGAERTMKRKRTKLLKMMRLMDIMHLMIKSIIG